MSKERHPATGEQASHAAVPEAPAGGPASELERMLRRPRSELQAAAAEAGETNRGFGLGSSLVADVLRVGNANGSRALIAWRGVDGAEHSEWLPIVRGIGLRTGDRVLLSLPGNSPEPLVVAIIDGSTHRPPLPADERGHLTLRTGESLAIRDAEGRPLLQLTSSEDGAVVQLAQPDLRLEVPGTLSLKAAAIDVRASGGPVEIRANDDVVLAGERVNIN